MTSFFRTTVGPLAVLVLLSGARGARADVDAANGFDMGLGMGFASFQASVNQQDLAQRAVSDAQRFADRLTAAGLLGKVSIFDALAGGPLLARLEQLRAQYEGQIRARSNGVANAYRLGLLIALAEGQCTAPDWERARSLARTALNEAGALIASSTLQQMGFDPQLLSHAMSSTNEKWAGYPYAQISVLRHSYRGVVLQSASQQRVKKHR